MATGETQVVAQPKVDNSLPAPVQLLMTAYANECKQLGGTLVGGKSLPEVQTVDLDGDGKPDYILDPKNLQCSASASLFCPNAGCEVRIATSENEYDDPLLILGGAPVVKGNAVEIEVQHFNCKDAAREETCISKVTWDGEKLIQSFAVRH
ncbi:MAG TPA: hypothetical protein VIX42_02530 [Edaphobacter sp.]